MTAWSEARRFVFSDIGSVPARSVAIVPGCRVYGARPSLVLADRLHAALALVRAEKVSRVIVSGSAAEVPVMAAWLAERAVAEDRIVPDPAGYRTLITMERAAKAFSVRDAVVCTNRFHVHRAVFLARATGMDAVGVVADRHVYASRRKESAREVVAQARAIFDVYVGRLTRDHRP